MKTTRRRFFGMMAAAVGAVVVKPGEVVKKEYKHVEHGHGFTVTDERARQLGEAARETQEILRMNALDNSYGRIPRNLQEGLNKIFSDRYGDHQSEFKKVWKF